MSDDMFTAGYLAASDRADDPPAESARWLPPHLHGDDADEWRRGFESWWEPQ